VGVGRALALRDGRVWGAARDPEKSFTGDSETPCAARHPRPPRSALTFNGRKTSGLKSAAVSGVH
jgi:hypothetical protein